MKALERRGTRRDSKPANSILTLPRARAAPNRWPPKPCGQPPSRCNTSMRMPATLVSATQYTRHLPYVNPSPRRPWQDAVGGAPKPRRKRPGTGKSNGLGSSTGATRPRPANGAGQPSMLQQRKPGSCRACHHISDAHRRCSPTGNTRQTGFTRPRDPPNKRSRYPNRYHSTRSAPPPAYDMPAQDDMIVLA